MEKLETINKVWTELNPDRNLEIIDDMKKLKKINLLCPFCLEEENENQLMVDMWEHNFFCPTCNEEYSAQEIIDKVFEQIERLKNGISDIPIILNSLNLE